MEDVIIASVVPAVMHSFNSAIIKYFGLTPIIVGPGIRTGPVLRQQIRKKQVQTAL